MATMGRVRNILQLALNQQRLTSIPDDFKLHPTVNKIIENRRLMGAGELPMDWGYAENMAYAALLDQGSPIRLSGQDSRRGTFSHRHAVSIDAVDELINWSRMI